MTYCAAVEWQPGVDEESVICGPPTATVPASSAVDMTLAKAEFRILRHEDRYAEDPQAEVLRRLESADAGQMHLESQAATLREAPESAAPQRSTADPYLDPRAHYPWATELETSVGQFKTKYGLKHGTVLQPLPLVHSSQAATERKKAFASNPRMSASVGNSHAASGGLP